MYSHRHLEPGEQPDRRKLHVVSTMATNMDDPGPIDVHADFDFGRLEETLKDNRTDTSSDAGSARKNQRNVSQSSPADCWAEAGQTTGALDADHCPSDEDEDKSVVDYIGQENESGVIWALGLSFLVFVSALFLALRTPKETRLKAVLAWIFLVLVSIGTFLWLRMEKNREQASKQIQNTVSGAIEEASSFQQDWNEEVLQDRGTTEATTTIYDVHHERYMHMDESPEVIRKRSVVFGVLVRPFLPLFRRRRKTDSKDIGASEIINN